MNPQTSTEQVTNPANGVAHAQGGDESRLTPELIERVSKLSRDDRMKLCELLDKNMADEFHEIDQVPQPSREEIQRRLNSIVDGTAVSYTVQETMAHLRSRTWREGQS